MVCNHYQWDYFSTEKSFSQWVFLFFGIRLLKYEELVNEKMPLAELSGEIAGGLFNPEGLREYLRMKKMHEAVKKRGEAFVADSSGGMAVSTSSLDEKGNIVDDKGNVIFSAEELSKLLNSF
ncbi:MAG: hypothetical protein ABIK31_02905 [candidate division WOR-3 bacterium]